MKILFISLISIFVLSSCENALLCSCKTSVNNDDKYESESFNYAAYKFNERANRAKIIAIDSNKKQKRR